MMTFSSFIKSFSLTLFLGSVAFFVFFEAFAFSGDGRCGSFANTVEHVLPAVVDISTHTLQEPSPSYNVQDLLNLPEVQASPLKNLLKDWPPADQNPASHHHSLGSGFIIDPRGYIVTNRHVIQGAEEIIVSLSDGRELPAQIIARDDRTDLALLKIETKDPLPSLKWGDSKAARVGDWILVIGSPFGFGRSVSAGIISARARDVSWSHPALEGEGIMTGYVDDLLQTDAAINLGNSGGPMVNTKGDVIGVNVAIFSPSMGSVGIGFAVPSSVAERTIHQMKEKGSVTYGWIGIRVQEIRSDTAKSLGYETDRLKHKKGAFVSFVDIGGPASKSGILPGDIILSYDGQDITSYKKLPRLVGETALGKKVLVRLWRQGKEISLPVIVEDWAISEKDAQMLPQENMVKIPLSLESSGTFYDAFLGIYVAPLTKSLRSQFNIPLDTQGLLIVGLQTFSPEHQKPLAFPSLGIQVDDILEDINQTKITSLQAFEDTLQTLLKLGKKTALLKLWRSGMTHYVVLNLASQGEASLDTKTDPLWAS